MKVVYESKEIMATITTNNSLLKHHFQKLYYAIIITNCNRYSSVANKQRIDVVLTDDNLKIISIKKGMHENTYVQDNRATTTILLPVGYFKDLKIGASFQIKEAPEGLKI